MSQEAEDPRPGQREFRPASRTSREERSWRDDLDLAPWIQRKQVRITTDDAVAFRIKGQCQKSIVFRVPAIGDIRQHGHHGRHLKEPSKELLAVSHRDVPVELLPRQHSGQLFDRRFGDYDFKLIQSLVDRSSWHGIGEQQAADPHVGIDDDPHSIQSPSNMSSFFSVIPRAFAASEIRSQKRWNASTLLLVSR